MISIFTCPRPFTDESIASIQRKALLSWKQLSSDIEVILMGKDEGVEQTALLFGFRHVQHIEYSHYGTPILSSIFHTAQKVAKYDILAYINADIILSPNLLNAVDQALKKWKRFALFSSPKISNYDAIDLSSNIPIYLQASNHIMRDATPSGTDVFVFTRGVYKNIPPFRLGKRWWDTWLMGDVVFRGIPAVDATEYASAYHPYDIRSTHIHDFMQKSEKEQIEIELMGDNYLKEVKLNMSLMREWYIIHRVNLPYVITKCGLIMKNKNSTSTIRLRWLYLMNKTYHLRRKLGLYRWWKPTTQRHHLE